MLLEYCVAQDAAEADGLAQSRTLESQNENTLRAHLEALKLAGWLACSSVAYICSAVPDKVLSRAAFCAAHECALHAILHSMHLACIHLAYIRSAVPDKAVASVTFQRALS